MRILGGVAGVVIIVAVLWDAFEALVLPRRVTRRFHATSAFYAWTWRLWKLGAVAMPPGGRRETYLSYYGPLSLLLLLQLWAFTMVIGFGLLQWSLGLALQTPGGSASLGDALYMSGSTFFTLGLGDIVPTSGVARALTVIEAGIGFMFLALMIGYFPVLNQAFARREISISRLDSRAGSPPSAPELLRRHRHDSDELLTLLREWERWAADLLESHVSYPVLSYFRSQHDNQSWLAALTTMLDTSALVSVTREDALARQARLTFAMARHAVVDLAQVLRRPPADGATEQRAPMTARVPERLAEGHDVGAIEQLAPLQATYDPYLRALSVYLLMPLSAAEDTLGTDNWRTSAWERGASGRLGNRDVHAEE